MVAEAVSAAKAVWQTIKIDSLRSLRRAADLRYENRQIMAAEMGVNYTTLNDVLAGRLQVSSIVAKLQKLFNLSDAVVLKLWPLLRRWPRPDLEERAMRRAG